jgi:hypothetical protein
MIRGVCLPAPRCSCCNKLLSDSIISESERKIGGLANFVDFSCSKGKLKEYRFILSLNQQVVVFIKTDPSDICDRNSTVNNSKLVILT